MEHVELENSIRSYKVYSLIKTFLNFKYDTCFCRHVDDKIIVYGEEQEITSAVRDVRDFITIFLKEKI